MKREHVERNDRIFIKIFAFVAVVLVVHMAVTTIRGDG